MSNPDMVNVRYLRKVGDVYVHADDVKSLLLVFAATLPTDERRTLEKLTSELTTPPAAWSQAK